MNDIIVVTRHFGLVEFLTELGIVDENTPVYQRASKKIVKNKTVCGVLPVFLRKYTKEYIFVPLFNKKYGKKDKGTDLSVEEHRKRAKWLLKMKGKGKTVELIPIRKTEGKIYLGKSL